MNDDKDKILSGRVREWLKAAGFIDSNLDRFSREEITTQYRLVRHMFKPGAERLSDEALRKIQQALYDESWNITDEFGTNLRSFSGKIGKIIESRDDFGRLVRVAEVIPPPKEDPKPVPSPKEDPKPAPPPKEDPKPVPPPKEDPTPVPPPRPEMRTVMKNGNRWKGKFLGDTPVESGKIYYSDGMIYEGQWSAYGPDGTGSLRHSDLTKWGFYSEFKRGIPTNKQLAFVWGNGDTYVAEKYEPNVAYSNLLRNTTGVYTFKKNGRKERGMYIGGQWKSLEKAPEPRIVTRLFTPAQIIITIVSIVVGAIACLTAISI